MGLGLGLDQVYCLVSFPYSSWDISATDSWSVQCCRCICLQPVDTRDKEGHSSWHQPSPHLGTSGMEPCKGQGDSREHMHFIFMSLFLQPCELVEAHKPWESCDRHKKQRDKKASGEHLHSHCFLCPPTHWNWLLALFACQLSVTKPVCWRLPIYL